MACLFPIELPKRESNRAHTRACKGGWDNGLNGSDSHRRSRVRREAYCFGSPVVVPCSVLSLCRCDELC